MNLGFHVKSADNPNVELDPADYFQIAETEDGDYIVPNDSSEIFALQWGRIEGEEGLHLFVYLDLLEGELLGDGCLRMHGSRSALYGHSSKYEEYLIWLSGIFLDLGLEQVGKINKYWDEEYETFGYHYQSRSYPELVPIRQQWYPNGKKIVPKDLRLNPTIVRQWLIGDGSLRNHVGGRPDIDFSTHAFDKASINHLLKELRGEGFIVSHRLSENRIGMSTQSVKDFLDWIGPCPIDCYSFKWNYQDNRKRARK